jgi:hypothetical protein
MSIAIFAAARLSLSEGLKSLCSRIPAASSHKNALAVKMMSVFAYFLRNVARYVKPHPVPLSKEERMREKVISHFLIGQSLKIDSLNLEIGRAVVTVINYDTDDGELRTHAFAVRRTDKSMKAVSVLDFILACLAGNTDRNARRVLGYFGGVDAFHTAIMDLRDAGYAVDLKKDCAVTVSAPSYV